MATPNGGSDIVGQISQLTDPLTELVSLDSIQSIETHRAAGGSDLQVHHCVVVGQWTANRSQVLHPMNRHDGPLEKYYAVLDIDLGRRDRVPEGALSNRGANEHTSGDGHARKPDDAPANPPWPPRQQ